MVHCLYLKWGGDYMRPFNSPDPDMKSTLLECIEDIREWPHYDNYQHGHYVNENYCGYGSIKVFNANVHIITHNLNPTELDEGYKMVWGKYPTWHTYFRGDLSKRRYNYLLELSKKYECMITVNREFGQLAFKISEGIEKKSCFAGYHKQCGNDIEELPPELANGESHHYVCIVEGDRVGINHIMNFKGDCDV